jgi:outer membrane lipoprotein carrier protein
VPRPRRRLIRAAIVVAGLAAPTVARSGDEPVPPPVPVVETDVKETKEPAPAKTPEEKAKRLLAIEAELARDLGRLKSLRMEFVQRKRLEVFDEEVESRGTLAIAVPGRLRWEVTSPVKTLLVVDGERALRARTSRKGVSTESRIALKDDPVAAGMARQLFLWLRGDLVAARTEYDLELLEEKPLRIRAVPKSAEAAKAVASVEIRFAEDRKSVAEVTLVESAKTKTVITFTAMERDPQLPKDHFDVGAGSGK